MSEASSAHVTAQYSASGHDGNSDRIVIAMETSDSDAVVTTSAGVGLTRGSSIGTGGVSESDREWMVSDQEEELVRLQSIEHLPDMGSHPRTDIRCDDSSSEQL